MKAIIRSRYGPPETLSVGEVDKPVPKDDEALIRVRASSINRADWIIMRGNPFVIRFVMGLTKPRSPMLGADVAGRVESVGKNVTRFSAGDDVFGELAIKNGGCYAEYACVKEERLAKIPAGVTYEEAGAVPLAGLTALQALKDMGGIKKGSKVLISGSSGGVGTMAVQIARSFGAEVTAVCSTGKAEMMRGLGADKVIDYSKEDFAKDGVAYDLILGVNGHRSIFAFRRSLAPSGTYIMVGGSGGQLAQGLLLGWLLSRKNGRKFKTLTMRANAKDMELLADLLGSRKLVPVIDKSFPFDEVQDAFRLYGKGHVAGKIVITID